MNQATQFRKTRILSFSITVALIGAAAALLVVPVKATPSVGVTTTMIAGPIRFDDIDLFVTSDLPIEPGELWKSRIHTNEESDAYVVQNDFAPGGTTGWHTHPGPSLVMVTMGEITAYESDSRNCRPHVYHTGEGFVDHGGLDHVHMLVNATSAPARTIATQLLPAGAERKIDANAPANCPP
jgi:quercetin dioxygenase-like cupin family protein